MQPTPNGYRTERISRIPSEEGILESSAVAMADEFGHVTTARYSRLDEGWLDLGHAAVVEVTSEEKDYGIEAALVSGETQGWRAANTGTQTIRLLFDHPQRLRRISLVFEENTTARTHQGQDRGVETRAVTGHRGNRCAPVSSVNGKLGMKS